ncbi:MAG: hypothetical protein M3O31_17610 [Acidobacteriota bacterium]|nr:hypothetical protein [Acidobacteriota bacterium]
MQGMKKVSGMGTAAVARGLATMSVLLSLLAAGGALAQTKLGPAAPVTYDNKFEVYGGLNYMNFKAGENLPKRMNLGGAEIEGTWWVTPKWGASAEYRGEAGTTQVYPIGNAYGIHRPLVYMNMGLFGVQYRGPKNEHAALNFHAYGGAASGVFDGGTQGAGPTPGVSATSNAQIVGLYNDHTAAVIALGGSGDFNRSKNWAIRLSPDLILEHFGNETREFFAISGGVVYRFPVRTKKK